MTEFMQDVLDDIFRTAAAASGEAWTTETHAGVSRVLAITPEGLVPVAELVESEWEHADHIALHSPATVISWVHAQRALLANLDTLLLTANLVLTDPAAARLVNGAAERAVRLMVQPYAARPGFNPAWSLAD
ncbi:hypothetical protein D1871_23070 [Nakamurella silvestris]|nr:hypothetical protein D1871_23070 [Nakamurella silvestris]